MAKSNFPPLLHLTFVLQHLSDEVLEREVGVSLSAARIMSVLDKSVPVSQRAVAVQLRQTEANVSRQLQAMKKHGLVSVTRNRRDNRQRDVVLSTKGYRTYLKAEGLLAKQQKSLLRTLDSYELKALSDFTARL